MTFTRKVSPVVLTAGGDKTRTEVFETDVGGNEALNSFLQGVKMGLTMFSVFYLRLVDFLFCFSVSVFFHFQILKIGGCQTHKQTIYFFYHSF